jgi:hypothetical protein
MLQNAPINADVSKALASSNVGTGGGALQPQSPTIASACGQEVMKRVDVSLTLSTSSTVREESVSVQTSRLRAHDLITILKSLLEQVERRLRAMHRPIQQVIDALRDVLSGRHYT